MAIRAFLLVVAVAGALGLQPAAASTCVQVAPGDDLAAVVHAHPPGESFCLAPGLYRVTHTVAPRAGDTLTGPATVTGAARVADWRPSGPRWTAAWPLTPHTNILHEKHMTHPEEGFDDRLFMDGGWLDKSGIRLDGRTVGSLTPGPGQYAVDYDADLFILGEDPAGHVLEAPVVNDVVSSDAPGVTLRDLDLTMGRDRAVFANAMDWTAQNVRVSNSTVGMGLRTRSRFEASRAELNAIEGLNGKGAGIVIAGSQIVQNDVVAGLVDLGGCWAAGGMKLVEAPAPDIHDNLFERNGCHAVWLDMNVRDARIVRNVVRDNAGDGIFYEISDAALVAGNTVVHNDGHGVIVGSSSDVTITGNTIGPNAGAEIYVRGKLRLEHGGPHQALRTVVTDNTVTFGQGDFEYGCRAVDDGDECATARYDRNHILIPSLDLPAFRDGGPPLTWAEWQAAGNDRNSTIEIR